MTLVTGTVQDIGMDPLSGALTATAVEFRTSGDVVIAPESRSWPIVAGAVEVDLLPGPTRLTIQVGSHARDRFDVVIPEEPTTLAALVEEAFPWTPPQVREFVRLRDETVAAAERAETAAGDVDQAIGDAADTVVQAVEQDRQAAEQARSGAESARDVAEGFRDAASGFASDAGGYASDAAGSASGASSSASSAAGSASDAEGSAGAAASSASDAASSASAAASSAGDAAGSASAASGHAQDAAGSASAALGHAQGAESWATSFDVSATATTGAPGSDATVDVSGDGPAYALGFTVPRGDQGVQGPPGEVSQAALDAAVASLVDGAPEALDTLDELASALGGDPNFATTVSEAIGKRAKIDGAPEEYDSLGKLVSALIAGELGGGDGVAVGTNAGNLPSPATVNNGIAGGWGAQVSGNDGIAIGTSATSDRGIAIGLSSVSGGSTSVAIAPWAAAEQNGAVAIGNLSQAGALRSTALGNGARATADSATALGRSTRASHARSVALGFYATTSADDEVAIGNADAHVRVDGTLSVGGDSVSVDGHTHTASEVGLGNVDNTADADKPVSAATQTALDAKVQLVSEFPSSPESGVLYLKADD